MKNSPDNGAEGTNVPERHFGPFFYSVHCKTNGLRFERDMTMPEGDAPWAFVRVRLSLDEDQPTRRFKLSEEWALKTLYVALLMVPEDREELAEEVTYEQEINDGKVKAQEGIDDADFAGSPATMMIESLNQTEFTATSDEALHPTITLSADVVLEPGETKEFYFRFGRFYETPVEKPETFYQENFAATKARLPKAHSSVSPLTTGEISWHGAALYGMMFKDSVLGEYTINQGCSYGFDIGINGAARNGRQDWAWKHLEMMSNHTKTDAYPNIWEGVLSGPDA
ncbi:hypothetical protein EOPP23_09895 [Endozoicomonas sp. OPT23]|uniref:hypothetical protein n=1 Tax=Endozoicomonas sp. OPT23 TaxID=2072845 RepID=UPI00129B0248|nr:hypothetical protein [Endozoicomonas sp. OPT23]MRI33294.1 hypothetical protein [Endozoicomonas sp. OPT23]